MFISTNWRYQLSRYNFFAIIATLVSLTLIEYKYSIIQTFISYLNEHNRVNNIVGIFIVLLIAYLASYKKNSINFKLILSGLLIHLSLGLIVLKTSIGSNTLEYISGLISKLYLAADKGIEFVFGKLSIIKEPSDFIFAIKVLPVIVFFGAFISLLFHLKIIQKTVYFISLFLRPILGTSGAETLCTVANSFLGQTEAPLLIKSYLKNMTRSEFMLVMISGMSTISAAILAVFASIGVPAKHLLASSILSIPASIIISKMLYPETETPQTLNMTKIDSEVKTINIIDAISTGTTDGLYLALNVGAMLIAFIALISMANNVLDFSCLTINNIFQYLNINFKLSSITLDNILGFICLPFGWLLGFKDAEAFKIAELIGTKIAINELVAYSKMVNYGLSERAIAITTYALCGFSNFSCIGIQIGAIGALVPEKRKWLSEFGLKAVLGGALANLLSALIAGLLL